MVMHIVAVLHTTENLGDHAREVQRLIAVEPGETVQALYDRVFVANERPYYGPMGREGDTLAIRVVQAYQPVQTPDPWAATVTPPAEADS